MSTGFHELNSHIPFRAGKFKSFDSCTVGKSWISRGGCKQYVRNQKNRYIPQLFAIDPRNIANPTT